MSAWHERVVVVTGASRGLGKAIAAEFVAAGARVVLVARDAARLRAVAEALGPTATSAAGSVEWIVADLADSQRAAAMIEEVRAKLGRIDVLVNNAGRSTRRRVIDAGAEHMRELLEANFLTAVAATQAALPELIERRGSVVLLGSLAAKAAGRWYGGYPAAKFALAAYAQQLRLELGPEGLHVLLVCPGPIAREAGEPSAVERLSEEERARLPEAALRPGGGVSSRAMPAERLAREIRVACERRTLEIVRPWTARVLFAIGQLSPAWGDWLVRKFGSG